jgi:hypothetical protein
MSVNDDKSKWNRVLNKVDCEIVQPTTPELCYPKSDVSNHPFTEKLFKYRTLHGNKCDPSPSQPCILDHTGLVLPAAVPIAPDDDINYTYIGNDLVIRYCEDFFSNDTDEKTYKYSYNGSYVDKSVEEVRSFIEDFYKNETLTDDKLEIPRPNSVVDKLTITLTRDVDGMVTLKTTDLEGLVIILPDTYIKYYKENDASAEQQAKTAVNLLAETQALNTIVCYVGNSKLDECCPGHKDFNPETSRIFTNYQVNTSPDLSDEQGNDTPDLSEYLVNKDNNKITVNKNRFRYTVQKSDIEETSDSDNNIDNRKSIGKWKDKFDTAEKNALSLVRSSLECTYGNQEQTAYCVYPVVQPNTTKGFEKPAVYGLYPDQLLKEGDILNNGCAVLTNKLFPLENLEPETGTKTNSEKHIAYIPTPTTTDGNNFEYNYFGIDKNTGEYLTEQETISEDITVYYDENDIGKTLQFKLWDSVTKETKDLQIKDPIEITDTIETIDQVNLTINE